MIDQNLKQVNDRIMQACKTANRTPDDVTLIAVSKTKPLEMLKEAYALGCRHFGENKVQELVDKIEKMPNDIRWHMIGHLQRNKVKYIVGKVACIHSVDSLRLAEEISKESQKKGCNTNILIEINIAEEESKFGTGDMQVNLQMIKDISLLPNLNIQGLMTIAPFTDVPESNRQYFKSLYEFSRTEAAPYLPSNPILSMGMTGDYTVAIEEGATHVRVGTGIFGERDYSV